MMRTKLRGKNQKNKLTTFVERNLKRRRGFSGSIFFGCLSLLDSTAIRRAIIMGSVMASFNVEDFSLGRLSALDRSEIEERFAAFKKLTDFSPLD